jgi:hypothetical protein
LFCLNAAGTGTYTQYSVPTLTQTAVDTGTVDVSGSSTSISASGKGLALLGEKTSTAGTFTETTPVPMKAGTFTLLTEYPPLTLSCPTPTGVAGTAYSSASWPAGVHPPTASAFFPTRIVLWA